MFSKSFSHAVLVSGADEEKRLSWIVSTAQKLLCDSQVNCQQCQSCLWIKNASHPDMLILPQEEKSSIKIEDVRFLQHFLGQTSHQGGAKIAVLAKADSMPIGAVNALLKTLEEPPKGSVLFLSSHYPHLLAATLRSRCQKISLSSQENIQHSLTSALIETLDALEKKRLSPFESAEKWQNSSLIEILDGLYYSLRDYILEKKIYHKNLFLWQDYLNTVRRQVLNKQNPNHLLALEHLFYQWVKLSAGEIT